MMLEGTLEDLEVLAQVYGIPRLMLDPLRVGPREATCLVQAFDQLLRIEPEGDVGYGVAAQYSIPGAKLAGTEDVALSHLVLAEGGHTPIHAHPGDEFLFVLEGTVEVRLMDSG